MALPLLRLEGDGAPPFGARAVMSAIKKSVGVALRDGGLGHISKETDQRAPWMSDLVCARMLLSFFPS